MLCITPFDQALDLLPSHSLHIIMCHTAGLDAEHTRQHLYQGPNLGPVVSGSSGANIVDGLEPDANETILVKKRFSPFFGTHLDVLLRRCVIGAAACASGAHRLGVAGKNSYAEVCKECITVAVQERPVLPE
jgi:nicotinamidase-related amidase